MLFSCSSSFKHFILSSIIITLFFGSYCTQETPARTAPEVQASITCLKANLWIFGAYYTSALSFIIGTTALTEDTSIIGMEKEDLPFVRYILLPIFTLTAALCVKKCIDIEEIMKAQRKR